MTNLNRIPVLGHSGASILAAALGPMEHSDPFYRALRRIRKREVLELCEKYSVEKGLRLPKRVLP